MKRFKWGDFPKLENAEELLCYLDGQEFRHGKYCHYSKLQFIENIVKDKTFQISCVKNVNDIHDKNQFTDFQRFYVLCFSTGENENLALWYLYSGMDGHGGRIRFTKNSISKLIGDSTYELWEYEEDDRANAKFLLKLNSDDFFSSFRDVIYLSDKKGKGTLKYNNMRNLNMKHDDLEQVKIRYSGFIKDIVWYHEKETRYLIELKDHIIAQLDASKNHYIAMRFSDEVASMLFVGFAPEVTSIEEGMKSYPSIQQMKEKKRELSEYSGAVRMNLCKNCKK